MKIQEKSFKNFIFIIIAEIIEIIFNFLVLFILTHIFSPNLYVYYSFSLAFFSFLMIFARFGIGTTIIKSIAALNIKNSKEITKLVSNGFRLVAFLSMITSITLFLFSNLIEKIYKMPGLGCNLQFITLYLFFSFIIVFFECTFQGLKKYKYYAISKIATNCPRLLIISLNFFVDIPIVLIIQIYAVFAMIQALFILLFVQLKFKYLSLLFSFNITIMKNILGFAIYVFFPVLFQYIYSQFNQFILALYVNSTDLAYFNLTLIIIQSLTVPLFIFSRFIFPYISNYMQNYDINRKQIAVIYNSVFKYGLLIMITISFYVFYFSENIVFLIFGPQYIKVSKYLRFFILYLNILILDSAGGIFLWASNKQKLVFKLSSITALLTIIMSILLIPFYYTYGAILSIIIPRSIYILYSISLVKKKNNIKLEKNVVFSILKYIISGIISVINIFIFIFFLKFNLNNLLNLLIFSGIYFGELFLLILILKGVQISEISYLFHLTRSLLNKKKRYFFN